MRFWAFSARIQRLAALIQAPRNAGIKLTAA